MKRELETVRISPTTLMSMSSFEACYILTCMVPFMERLPNGNVLWDDGLDVKFSQKPWKILRFMLHFGFWDVTFEVPKSFLEENFPNFPNSSDFQILK